MNEVTVINPQELMNQAQTAAGVSKKIVEKTSMRIGNKNHVAIEGWQAIAVANGCTLGARDVKKVDGGYTALGELRRISDGMVLATAEGFVGDTERTWADKPEHAKRAMAQTRAMSRVGRSAFAHIVVMMDSGLSTTPAEEMDGVDTTQSFTTAPGGSESRPISGTAYPKLNFHILGSEVSAITDSVVLKQHKAQTFTAFPKMTEKQTAVANKIYAQRFGELGPDVSADNMFPPED